MNSTKRGMICRVCGGKAIARNFCAVTCESCKAFFRRHAKNMENLKCGFGNNCEIEVFSRTRCRKCRLVKCFRIGMRKEWILSENEKRDRNQKIEENRKRRMQNTSNDCSSPSLIVTNSDDNPSQNTNIEIADNESDSVTTDSDTKPTEESLSSYSDCSLSQSPVPNSTEIVAISRPLTDYQNNLNEREGQRLTELLEASKFLTIWWSEITEQIKITDSLNEVLTLTAIIWDEEIRKIIKTAKTLSAFKCMCEDDKLTLLKHGCVEIAFLRSIMCYDSKTEYYMIPLDESRNLSYTTLINLDVFKQKSIENYDCFKRLLDKLSREWELDHLVLHLLFSIILFNPIRPNLQHRELIRLQHEVYIKLLTRYLQIKYRSEDESKARLTRFIDILKDLHLAHESYIRPTAYADVGGAFLSYSPLLKEIYDK